MFKLKATPKQILYSRARPGDIIICTLPENTKDEFLVNKVFLNGVLMGNYLNNNGHFEEYTPWMFGEHYNILGSAFIESGR